MNLVKRRSLRNAIRSRDIIYGLNMQLTDETVAEVAALSGFDFLRLDLCHYPYTVEHAIRFIRTADSVGLPIIARIDDLEQAAMLLDFGLAGVMFQQVQNAEQAKRIVNACRYHPLGCRNMSKYTRTKRYGKADMSDSLAEDNDESIVVIQIEDAEGLKNMKQIFAIPGIDLVCSGRNDLSEALGVPGQTNHPSVVEAEDEIIRCALEAGLLLQMTARSQAQTEAFIRKGVTILTIGRDLELMQDGMEALLEERNQLRSAANKTIVEN